MFVPNSNFLTRCCIFITEHSYTSYSICRRKRNVNIILYNSLVVIARYNRERVLAQSSLKGDNSTFVYFVKVPVSGRRQDRISLSL